MATQRPLWSELWLTQQHFLPQASQMSAVRQSSSDNLCITFVLLQFFHLSVLGKLSESFSRFILSTGTIDV